MRAFGRTEEGSKPAGHSTIPEPCRSKNVLDNVPMICYIAYMKKGDLAAWEQALRQELDDLKQRRAKIEASIQLATRKLDLIRQMQSLDGVVVAQGPSMAAGESKATPTSVRDLTRTILSEAGHPLHISEIHREFLSRGLPIPGSGTPFNILAHLVNDANFVRVARGTYALSGTVPESQVLQKAPRVRHKRKRRPRRQKEDPRHGI